MKTSILTRAYAATVLILAGLLLGGCAATPSSYVVLINNDDGTVGQVEVSGIKGSTVLAAANHSAFIGADAHQTFVATPEQIHKDFGAAIMARPEKPATFLLYFDVGGARLTAESERQLPLIVTEIGRRAAPDISIIGHTDTAGDSDTNEQLGLERAQFVGGLLSSPKLNSENVRIISHGEKNLLIATPDNVVEARNRRVEVTVR